MLTNPVNMPAYSHLQLLKLVKRGDRHGAVSILAVLEAAPGTDANVASRSDVGLHCQLKAALEAQDELGDGTALIWAASHGFDGLVDRLLADGASINARATNNGMTALHAAAERGRTLLVRRLIDWNADVDARTRLGDTACHLAAYRGHVDTVRLLLESGTNWTLRNWRRNDILDEALASNSAKVVTVVKSCINTISTEGLPKQRHTPSSTSRRGHSLPAWTNAE